MKKTIVILGVFISIITANAQSFTAGNLAVFVAAASASNTTASIVELSSTVAGPAVNAYPIDGTTLPNALRFSGSATSTGYLALTNDRSLLTFTGGNTNNTLPNINTITTRAVGTFNSAGVFNLATTYTGASGQQTRGASSLFNTNWYIGDQNGLYTNGSVSASPTGNLRSVKSFGGTTYIFSASTTLSPVSTVTALSGGTLVGLPGLGLSVATRTDFYMVSSGANGSTFDVLYILDAVNATTGTILKYSLVAGNWVANGSYATSFGGFGLAAETSGGGANLFVSTGTGANTANSIIKLTDLAGYNTTININTPSNVTLFTTAAGTIIKGVSFAPVAMPTPPTVQFAALHQSVLENVGTANVTLNIANPNALVCKAIITTSVHTTATGGGVDYTLATDTVSFPALSSASQNLVVNINNDVLPENAEYVSFKIASFYNGTLGANQYHILYIRDNDYTPPTPTNEVMLQLLGSYSNGPEGTNSAEIVAYDSASQKLVIANSIGTKLDIVGFSNPLAPGPLTSINISALGNINSIAVRDGIIAVALENTSPQSNGKILFYNMTGTLISQVDAGAMPDMITFNNAGTKVYAACEGEPNAAYTLDPEGTIAVVDISGGVASVTNANVTMINFNSYDSQIASLRTAGVRIFGNNGTATVSQDFEPEYITISDDDSKAWVSLQENNALAVVNLLTNTVTSILPLGTINHSLVGNGMDASDQSSGINIANYPVRGVYMPDAIAHLNIGGTNYIFTANEGDARAYAAPNNEESRISGLTLDPTVFVDQNILKSNFMLGRLNATTKTGDTDNDGDIDEINVYGGRGFSVWSETGTLIFNSGNLLEKIIANNPTFSPYFNANHGSGAVAVKNRSDDKGPEIEGVAVANIDGDNLLFASAERLGGVFIFNIDNPASPRYVGYYNNRLAGNNPDRGAEGIIYISASASPNGNDLVILANEVSSTLTIFQVNTCASLSGTDLTFTPNDSICAGTNVTFSTPVGANTNLQWLVNNTNIGGATGTSTIVNTAGNYSLAVQNTALLCSDTTAATTITIITNPTASITTADSIACAGDQLTLDASGGTITWNNGITDNTPFTPSATDYYVATAANAFGCTALDSILVAVNSLPAVGANVTDNDICIGSSVTFNGSNAVTYTWNNGVTNNVSFTPASSNTYTVTGTDANLCSNTATVTVTVNSLPSVGATVTDNDICFGASVTFNGTNAVSYTWNNGVTNNVSFTPASTNTYTVTGTNANLCSNTATITVTVNPLPSVGATVTDNDICEGSSVTFNGTNATTYTWDNGVTNNVSFTPNSTNTYTVTGTDLNNCSNTSTVTVTVHPLPTVVANVTDNDICLGTSVTFTGSGASTYTWNNGVINGTPIVLSSTNTYIVTGTDVNACSNTSSITVTVHSLPAASINLLIDSVCFTSGSITLTGASPAGGFYSGLGVTGNIFDPSIGSGTYPITYTYTDANGCSDTDADNILVSGCLAINNENSDIIALYPNPTDAYFYIKASSNDLYSMSIIDMNGSIIRNSIVSNGQMIDITSLATGVYIVELKHENSVYRARMIKK